MSVSRVFKVLLLLAAGMLQAAVLKTAPFYGDNMVLQREKPIVIIGKADAGAMVQVEFMKMKASAKADAKGDFKVVLPKQKACVEGCTVTLKSGDAVVALTNVVVGDVWFCTGQSNMEFNLGGSREWAAEDVAKADFPLIRRVKFGHTYNTDVIPADEMKVSTWTDAKPANLPQWTAVGFYFVRKLHQETGVPMGILDCNWGGTRIEPWTPAAEFALNPAFANDVKTLANRVELSKKADELNKVYMAELAASTNKAAVKKPNLPWNHQSPSAIYNTMVDGMTVMPIKGAIWYQGESNAGDSVYDLRMQAMLQGWAKKWGYVLPFYYVQLANFQAASEDVNNTGWGQVRQCQLNALKLIPQSGMAVTIDIGEAKDIHPKNKFDVGERLARWALRDLYGKKGVIVSGPLYKSMVVEGSKIRVSFDYAKCCGLMVAVKNGMVPAAEVKDGKLEGFAIQAKDGKWAWADAVIDGTTVVVSNPEVKDPINVRYAYQSNPKANLYNKTGLPASPFTTETK